MQWQFYTPESQILKQYMEGYYFICDNQPGGTEKYLTYPNNYCIVTANLNAEVKLATNSIFILPSRVKNIYASIVYHYVNPVEVYYETPIQEITVYFKPLGIHHFVDNMETMFSQKKMTEFTPKFTDFKAAMKRLFSIQDRTLQIAGLEAYWLSKLRLKKMVQVEKILSDIESNMKIEEIARAHHISRKHLYQLVQQHLGKSPVAYRKIFRFRNAINSKASVKNLTELSYENFFYDQPHLIKDFKTLTQTNPHSFFKNVNTANKNIWYFL